MMNNSNKKLSFEEAISQLEDIISKFNHQDLFLDDSINLYEKGIHLIQHCEKKLNIAENKIYNLKDVLKKNIEESTTTTTTSSSSSLSEDISSETISLDSKKKSESEKKKNKQTNKINSSIQKNTVKNKTIQSKEKEKDIDMEEDLILFDIP